MNNIISSLKMLLLMTVLTGIIYPVFITAVGQVLFNREANGSMITANGKIVGSELIGQNILSDKYFKGRPSAVNYETVPSGAANKSVTNRDFNEYVNKNYNVLVQKYNTKDIPQELYLNSGSGLDPHISQKAALIQIDSVAEERKLSYDQKKKVKKMIYEMTEKRDFGIFGEERINVLKLNIAVDLIK